MYEYNLSICKHASIGEICPLPNIIREITKCEYNLFFHGNWNNCTYESISTPYFITRLSDNSFHSATLKPMELKVRCKNENKIRITNNMRFTITPGCSFRASGKLFRVPLARNIQLNALTTEITQNITIFTEGNKSIHTSEFLEKINDQINLLSADLEALYLDTLKPSGVWEPEMTFMEKVALTCIILIFGLYLLKAIFQCVIDVIHRTFNHTFNAE